MIDFAERRARLVEHIAAHGIRDQRVLRAIGAIPRELFVPHALSQDAYVDTALPIGARQTISQPYIVALMIEALALEGGETVLEVGGGSGYAAAVVAEIAGQVFTIERIAELARWAARNLAAAGCQNVRVRHADGTDGWPEEAPFDAILVSAAAPEVPRVLLQQLKIGGRMVVPVGSDPHYQDLACIVRVGPDDFERTDISEVRFVPLIGRVDGHSDASIQ